MDIEKNNKSYPDEILVMKMKSDKTQILTELAYFTKDKASDDEIDNYMLNMMEIIDNYIKHYQELNKDNRTLSEEQMWTKLCVLCETYTSIMKSKLIKSKQELNKCHDSTYKLVTQEFKKSHFAERKDRDHFKARLKESLVSAKNVFADQIKQHLTASYHELIDEKLSMFISVSIIQ